MSLSALKGDEEGLEDSIKDVENGRFSVVYVTPDALLLNERWRSILAGPLYSTRLCAVAVDEAHVIKQWQEEYGCLIMSRKFVVQISTRSR